MIIKCEVCGAEFESKGNCAKYCSRQCKNVMQNRRYHMRKAGLLPPLKKREKKKVNQSLIDITVKAREMGLSYGQYIAMTEGGQR